MITIDGIVYNVNVRSCKRTADVLDKSAERTADGRLHREILGVYFNYKLQFAYGADPTAYNALFTKLTEPVEFHTVIIPGGYTFSAYIASVSDDMVRVDNNGVAYYRDLSASFIAELPALIPS
jgi:hypothetical protein